MSCAAVKLGGAAFHAAIAMSGIVSKRGAPRHEISKRSAKAPTFLFHIISKERNCQVFYNR